MHLPFSLLVCTALLTAQQPPILTTPPVQTAQFGAAALGAGITQVAQLTMLYQPGSSPAKWYVTGTVLAGTALFGGYTGEATRTGPGTYTVTNFSAAELVNVPPPIADYFAFNASADRKVLVFDTGPTSAAAVYVRTNSATGTPWIPFGSIGAPVPVGYRDSQLGNTITSWNGSSGVYEYVYVDGLDIKKIRMTLTAPSTVTLGAPATIARSATTKHSPSPMRQWTGPAAQWGTARALLFSNNTPGLIANSWFRASIDDDMVDPSPLQTLHDDVNWKANPAHIGGSTYWAYATTSYQNPLQEDICAMNSVTVPAAGGSITLCGWAPPGPTGRFGFLIAGSLQNPGIDLSALGIRGLLGIGLASMVVLPAQSIDPILGETSWTFVMPPSTPGSSLSLQFGCLEIPPGQVNLANNAIIKTS